MKIPYIAVAATVFFLALILFACTSKKFSPMHESVPTNVEKTDFPSPSPSPLPSSTPTSEPFVHQSKIEVVTDEAAIGDGGNNWGGHQARIVHTEDGIFTAYTVAGSDDLNREWRLAERMTNGSWNVIAKGESGREPVNLLASPDGTLNIIGWPKGLATIWSGKPKNDTIEMISSRIPNELIGNWPYNSAGIDASGNICVISSEGGERPGGSFYIACYLPSKDKWITQKSRFDYRFCYTYVFPGLGGQLVLVSTRDVRWEALDYEKPAGQFDYVFNAIGVWNTNNIFETSLERIFQLEEKPTSLYPAPNLEAQEDAYVDTKGQIHIIYRIQGQSTNGQGLSRHMILNPDGIVINDVPIPENAGDYSRIFQDRQGIFYLLGSSGIIYPLGDDGIQYLQPIILDLGGYWVEYSGFGVSVPRTGTPIDNTVEVVFPSGNGTKWLYFQLDFSKP